MEFFIILALIFFGICGLYKFFNLKNKHSSHTTATSYRNTTESAHLNKKHDLNVYRPKSKIRNSKSIITFKESGSESYVNDIDIKDLVDALTGAPLQKDAGLFQCKRCKVFYQEQSVEVIRAENQGRCVSCLHAELISVSGRSEQRGRNADVNVVTLENYREKVGHVITFEGYVHKVLTSRRGTDYAVMFESASWTKGFKMVAFRGSAQRIGGRQYLISLENKTVRVRGLLVNHKTFGYQIIINDPAMIISVQ